MSTTEFATRLLDMVRSNPTARIVSDVGSSMLSGWGDVKNAIYHEDQNVIELIFD